jgi:PhzF family phenazine biosynthesis protein
MKIVAHVVNAFTANSGGGNAAGIVLDADVLNETQMLAIARRLGFSETAFVCKSDTADYRLRFFTVTGEVDLCGHATIAAWALMHQTGIIKHGDFTQETKAGLLRVDIHADGVVYMEQAQLEFLDRVEPEKFMAVLGISADALHPHLQPQIVSTGLKDLLVAVKDEATLHSLRPDFPAMAALSVKLDLIGMHVFALGDDYAGPTAFARNFFPRFGTDEESATGTANGALLCYLKNRHALPKAAVYRIEQGQTMGALSYIYGKFKDGGVWTGGTTKVAKEHILAV